MSSQAQNMGEILRRHELASRTIKQHNTPLAIFDQNELNLLRQFVVDPSEANQIKVLQSYRGGIWDGENVGDNWGAKAREQGSLAGYVVARYGKTNDIGSRMVVVNET